MTNHLVDLNTSKTSCVYLCLVLYTKCIILLFDRGFGVFLTMFKFFRFFSGGENKDKQPLDLLEDSRGWFANRYNTVVVQRNVLFLITLASLACVGLSGLVVLGVSKSRTIEPFVVEVEKKSGITTLVNPMTVKQYSADEVLNRYFVIEYIRARELFDPNNFQYNFYVKVRLFSAQNVYNEFRNWIRLSNADSPINLYSSIASGDLKIRSIQNLRPDNMQIRFTLEFTKKGGDVIKKDRIATISFSYVSIEMNEQQRQINPLGFQITYYRADDEFL